MKLLVQILLVVCLGFSAQADESEASGGDYLVGIYYFAGWWQQSPNKWETGGHDWRSNYSGRIPLLGEYNDQATMDREIVVAASRHVEAGGEERKSSEKEIEAIRTKLRQSQSVAI